MIVCRPWDGRKFRIHPSAVHVDEWTDGWSADGCPRPRRPGSDSSQQRKIQELFIVMCLVLGKWCGFFVHKWRSLNSQKKILWIFCPQMTLTQFPICGFFVHNFQIGVKAISQIFTSQNWIASTSVKPLYNIRFMVVRMACESLLIFKILKCWKLWKYKNHQFGTCCFDNLWKCGHVITYMSQMVFS